MENELFEKMPIQKAYMKLALPVVFSGVLTLVYNMVDMFFCGKDWRYESCGRCNAMWTNFYIIDCYGGYFWPWRGKCDF